MERKLGRDKNYLLIIGQRHTIYPGDFLHMHTHTHTHLFIYFEGVLVLVPGEHLIRLVVGVEGLSGCPFTTHLRAGPCSVE